MDRVEFDRRLDAQLRRLPAVSAPPSLAKRVTAAVDARAQERSSPRRARRVSSRWRRVWMAAAGLALAGVAGFGALAIALQAGGPQPWWELVLDGFARVTDVAALVPQAVTWATGAVATALAHPLLAAVLGTIVAATIACAGLGLWLARLSDWRLDWSEGASR